MTRARRVSEVALVVAVVVVGGLAAAPAVAAPVTTTTTGSPTSSTTPTTTSPTTSSTTTSTPTTSTSTPTTTLPEDPAPAAVSAITVTPDTELGYSQDVAIHGEGFSPNVQVGFAECETGEQGQDGCDLSTLGFSTTDANGEFSSTMRVRRFLHNTLSGTIDCAAIPESCIVSSGRLDATELAAAPLTFDPNAPIPPPPTITVDTQMPLTGIDVPIGVTGSGFEPNAFVQINQCKHGSTAREDCSEYNGFAQADGAGNFSTGATAYRGINTPNDLLVDCADPPGCDLVAVQTIDPDRPGVFELEFSDAAPLPPGLEVGVDPDTDLADNQIVAVTLSGLDPQESAIVAQCPAGQGVNEACAQERYVFTDTGGAVVTALRLQRTIGTATAPIDCADPGACEIVALGFNNHFHVGAAPLDFDPAAPPLPGPTLVVTPDTDLVHQQVVTVTGSGFLPNVFVTLIECTGDDECGFFGSHTGFAMSDADGNIATTFAVQRGIRLGDGTVFDCVDPPGCELVGRENLESYDGFGAVATAPIAFDADVPPPPPPEVIADPPGPYADRQNVSLTSHDFEPNELVFALQCAGATAAPSQCQGFRTVFADGSGTVHTALRVHRFMELFDDTEAGAAATVDCAFDECSLVLFSFDDPFGVGTTPLVIDPNAPPVPPATLEVAPTVDLEDGQVVSVTGSGFAPGAAVFLVECRADAPDESGRACDLSKTLTTASARDDGTIDATFKVRRTLNTSLYGTIDCAIVAEGCILGWGADPQFERGNVPLHFAGDPVVDVVEGSEGPEGAGLPRTGSDATRLAAWGALAVVAGVVLRVGTRRRRRGPEVIAD